MASNTFNFSIPEIESQHYWFVRTSSGKHYADFTMHSYIAINWDEVSVSFFRSNTENTVKRILQEKYYNNPSERPENDEDVDLIADTSTKQQVTLAYNKLRRFINGFQIGDTVLIPDRNSENISIGLIESDVYEDEDYDTRYYAENPGTEITPCPFKKRRRVKWLKHLSKDSMDVFLAKAINAQHSVSCIDDYSNVINRNIYNLYTYNDSLHAIIRAGHPNGLSFGELKELITTLDEALKDASIAVDEVYNPAAIDAKIAFHSIGILEISAAILSGATAISMVILALNHYRHGGKTNINFSLKSEKFEFKFEVNSESKGTLEFADHQSQFNLEAVEKLKRLEEPLDIKYPEIVSSVDGVAEATPDDE